MEDRDWKILQVLYEEKNITKAAQLMYMSQPALTSRLRQIEQEFEVQIVHRSSKGIQFTPEGELLVTMADEFLSRMAYVKEQVKQLSDEQAGTLIIGASSYFTMYTLPIILNAFKEEYPNVSFNVITDWTKNVFGMVYAQKANIGFVSVDYGGVKNIHCLFEEPICITYTKPFELSDLPRLPRIVYQSDYLIQSRLDKWWRENFSALPIINMQVDKLATCGKMVAAGLGYAFLPKRMTLDIENAHTMDIFDSQDKKITRKSSMIYNEQSANLPVVKLFVDFVKNMQF